MGFNGWGLLIGAAERGGGGGGAVCVWGPFCSYQETLSSASVGKREGADFRDKRCSGTTYYPRDVGVGAAGVKTRAGVEKGGVVCRGARARGGGGAWVSRDEACVLLIRNFGGMNRNSLVASAPSGRVCAYTAWICCVCHGGGVGWGGGGREGQGWGVCFVFGGRLSLCLISR